MLNSLINDRVKAEINQAVLCWLATIDQDGFPSVTPKQVWGCFDGNTLVVADIASPGSVSNIRRNAAACVSFLDVFRQKGFKLTGNARVVAPNEPDFDVLAANLIAEAGERFQVRNVIALTVDSVKPIIAPSYGLYQASEAEMLEDSYQTYGVRPIQSDYALSGIKGNGG